MCKAITHLCFMHTAGKYTEYYTVEEWARWKDRTVKFDLYQSQRVRHHTIINPDSNTVEISDLPIPRKLRSRILAEGYS
jgi:hypothetical protein